MQEDFLLPVTLVVCPLSRLPEEKEAMRLLARWGMPSCELERIASMRSPSSRLQSIAARLATVRALMENADTQKTGNLLCMDRMEEIDSSLCPGECLSSWEIPAGGKPRIRNAPFDFSLSHTDRAAVCAMTTREDRHIGVDMECLMRPLPAWKRIADRMLTDRERQEIQDAPSFLRMWTRKEAMVKALGCGLSRARSLDITALPAQSFAAFTWEDCYISVCLVPRGSEPQEQMS